MSTLKALVLCAGVVGFTTSGAGCAGYIQTTTGFAAAERPPLVSIGADLWVVENHSEAIFFSDGFYWTLRGGSWHRSTRWTSDFVVVRFEAVPVGVRTIERPTAYAYYRAPAAGPEAQARRVPPGHDKADKRHGLPPGHGGTPPGHGGTPPGHGGTPPGHAMLPPGQAKKMDARDGDGPPHASHHAPGHGRGHGGDKGNKKKR